MRWWFPWYIGSETPAVAEPVPETPRWVALTAAAKAWQDEEAVLLPRFNRLYQQEAGAPQFVRTDDAVH